MNRRFNAVGMKNLANFVFLLVLASVVQAREFTGLIIRDNDTTNVSFKVSLGLFSRQPELYKLRKKIVYFGDQGERKVLKAIDAQEVHIHFGMDTIVMKSIPNPYSHNRRKSKYYFLKLEEDGAKLKFYIFYDEETSCDGMGTDYSERYLLQKMDSKLISISSFSFRKTMLKVIDDCPPLQHKIATREYRRKDLKKIVRYYNEQCPKIIQ